MMDIIGLGLAACLFVLAVAIFFITPEREKNMTGDK
jgi:hypothetical protein